jgi:hypothetical protein
MVDKEDRGLGFQAQEWGEGATAFKYEGLDASWHVNRPRAGGEQL